MAEPLKNMYNRDYVDTVAQAVRSVYTEFDVSGFKAKIFDTTWQARELKDRTRHITVCLRDRLPDDYREALAILRQAATSSLLERFSYENMIFPDFVEVYGLDDWEASLPTIEQFTQQSSGEFAVRPFILQDSERMMAQMQAWAQHENHHVRRLASEGCRPRLPWAVSLPAFKQDPSPILPILHTLKNDPSEYVRRSVANNINDIAKDNPQVVLDVLAEWNEYPTEEIRWITRHGLRTLVKAGNVDALALLGYSAAAVRVEELAVKPERVRMGDNVQFEFAVVSEAKTEQPLMIDYVMHFVRANGSTNAKVFKLKTCEIKAGERLHLSKSHSFKPISTRRYYPGTHAIEIQINGVVLGCCEFDLIGG